MADPAIMLERAGPAVADIARPGLSARIEAGLGIAKLRIFGSDFDARFKGVVGFVPPKMREQADKKGLTFAWMAPGEWLVTGAEADVVAWVARITAQGADDVLAIDISHARVSFLLEGADARTAVAAHSPLDLWPDVFPVGAVARSLFGDTGMFIARLADANDAPRFRIIVDQTMAPYAGRLLARA